MKAVSLEIFTVSEPRAILTWVRSVVRMRAPSDSVIVHIQPTRIPPTSMVYQRSSTVFHFAGMDVCAIAARCGANAHAVITINNAIGTMKLAGIDLADFIIGFLSSPRACPGASVETKSHRGC